MNANRTLSERLSQPAICSDDRPSRGTPRALWIPTCVRGYTIQVGPHLSVSGNQVGGGRCKTILLAVQVMAGKLCVCYMGNFSVGGTVVNHI